MQRAVIDRYVEPRDRSLGNTRKHFGGCRINTADLDVRITRKPTDITTREYVGTELIQKVCISKYSAGNA